MPRFSRPPVIRVLLLASAIFLGVTACGSGSGVNVEKLEDRDSQETGDHKYWTSDGQFYGQAICRNGRLYIHELVVNNREVDMGLEMEKHKDSCSDDFLTDSEAKDAVNDYLEEQAPDQ